MVNQKELLLLQLLGRLEKIAILTEDLNFTLRTNKKIEKKLIRPLSLKTQRATYVLMSKIGNYLI